jgi:hypothetical protein
MDDDDWAELYGTAPEEPASTVKAPDAANGESLSLTGMQRTCQGVYTGSPG